ncbi:NAD(P)H-dependent oxidoreductase [Alteromonas sp. ASW11-36]|uniref:NAD(P)H-dependent oxidoreductase n=1 Tax=Alteromonas arenosi TaxID=3055817 RepID=A0ABT7SY75_9ALTE|nr:NAD(P)H-dependent oxidoreductase [Alteromonas sp. ASW11-36]MDM7861147.1 NAD(P)H-dependent oxidoreductase [Alteromonas sp. ASW11-36]
MKIGIVYFSATDITGTLVSAVCKQFTKMSVAYISHKICGKEIIEGRFENRSLMTDLHNCNAIIFASPTYMGSVSAQFKAFADSTSEFWERQSWAGKIACGITSGSGMNGDQSSTLQYLVTFSSQHGMLWLGLDAPFGDKNKNVNRLGCQLGVTAHSEDGKAADSDVRSAEYLAKRVVSTVTKMKGSF